MPTAADLRSGIEWRLLRFCILPIPLKTSRLRSRRDKIHVVLMRSKMHQIAVQREGCHSPADFFSSARDSFMDRLSKSIQTDPCLLRKLLNILINRMDFILFSHMLPSFWFRMKNASKHVLSLCRQNHLKTLLIQNRQLFISDNVQHLVYYYVFLFIVLLFLIFFSLYSSQNYGRSCFFFNRFRTNIIPLLIEQIASNPSLNVRLEISWITQTLHVGNLQRARFGQSAIPHCAISENSHPSSECRLQFVLAQSV